MVNFVRKKIVNAFTYFMYAAFYHLFLLKSAQVHLSAKRLSYYTVIICIFFLTSCTSIKPIGTLGPKKLQVYTISDNDFLSASRMIVILNEQGDVIASTGSTVEGAGAVTTQMVGSFVIAASIFSGSQYLQHGLENVKAQINATIKGIPSKMTLITDNTFRLGRKAK